MPDKNQIFIYNDEELSLLKNTFAENDTLLHVIRKVLLQFPLLDPEKNLLKLTINKSVARLIRKRMMPVLSPEFPLGQIPSILTTLTDTIKSHQAEEMASHFAAKKLEMDYLSQQLAALEDIEAPQPIRLNEMGVISGNTDTDFVNMTAYLFLLGYIDPMLLFIKSLAGQKEETIEEQKKRLTRDSNK